MRVLHVIAGLGGGGTERSLAELLPALAAAGVETAVVCFDRRRGAHEEIEAAGIPVTVLPARGGLRRLTALRRHLAERRPHIVHTSLFQADLAGRLAAAGTGVAVLGSLVSTPYAPVRLRDPELRRWRLRRARLADAFTARWMCDHFHAVSEAAKAAAVAALGVPPDRVTVIPRGRDPERLGCPSAERRRRARSVLGLAETDEVVIGVGRHEFAKGHTDLVVAVARLAERRPRLKLLIAGRRGASTGRLEAAIGGAGLSDRALLLGHRDDLPEVLAAADLLAFPSLYEGMPGAVIEAMALALPVVASDIAPVREIVEPEGSAELVPPEDAAALAVAIDGMLADPKRAAAFGRRGRRIFEERFTLERSVRGLLDLYRRLAESVPRGAVERP